MPQSYREKSKRLLAYLAENEQIDEKKNEFIIQGKPYNLIDLLSDLIVNRKRVESYAEHLYNFLKSSKFPKSFITNKPDLKKLKEHSPSTLLKVEDDDFKSFLENTSTPAGNLTLVARLKRRRIDSSGSMQKGCERFTSGLWSKWIKF